MITNVYEKLKPGGCYICISHGIPETRLNFLELVISLTSFLINHKFKERWSTDIKW